VSTRNDQAVVLRLTEYSETSQIATLFSAQHGLVRLIAKGARRSTKKQFAAGLDLLELGEVCYLPPRGDAQLGTLTEWVQRETFTGLRRELLRLHGALYAIELVASLTEDFDPHPELFGALVALLRGLAGPEPAEPLLPRFQLDLLRAIGYEPNLEQCVDCRREVRPGALAFFSAQAGGLICRDCEPHHIEKRRLEAGLLGAQTADPRAWFELLDYHLTYTAGKRFQTAEPVRKLLAARGRGGS